MKAIAHVFTDFKEKFGIPRQSGIVDTLRGRIIFEKEYAVAEAVRGLEEFSHIWIIWEFSKNKRDFWSPTVRPPKLGGNKRVGVFATRSPFRPNPVGLSCVELESIEYTTNGPVLHVKGADLLNNTPVYDIKPYLPYADCYPDAKAGFTENIVSKELEVNVKAELFYSLSTENQLSLLKILSSDPRPSYHDDERIYGFKFNDYEIKFNVEQNKLNIISIEIINGVTNE